MNEVAIFNVQDLGTMAQAIAKSGLFGMKTADQALALMLVAQAENQHPATITQDYDIIQGKACRKTHSVMARFQQMGGRVEWHALTDTIAEATFSHAAGGSVRIAWTFEQAKKAGLTGKDNWKNYPRAMLRARCIAEGIRTVYPAAIGGMMIAEEAQDTPMGQQPPIDMGSAERVTDPTPPPAKPAYTAEQFDKAMPGWVTAVGKGKEPANIIATVETKYSLTEGQKQAILDINVVDAEFTPPTDEEFQAAIAGDQQ